MKSNRLLLAITCATLNWSLSLYNNRAGEIAKECGVRINDIYAVAVEAGIDKILRESDGIHLSKHGERVIGKQVAETVLNALLKRTAADNEASF